MFLLDHIISFSFPIFEVDRLFNDIFHAYIRSECIETGNTEFRQLRGGNKLRGLR
jgi:hypothetical protein